MSAEPWSNRPKISALDTTDILMRRTPIRAVKNQEIPFSDIIPFIYENIPTLTDGKFTILSSAQIAFEQGGSVFRGTVRPNPLRQINVQLNSQLVNELGGNLEIPDGVQLTIVIDNSFTINTPIKLGIDSGLEIYGSTTQTNLAYLGAGGIFQNLNPGNQARQLSIHSLGLVGDINNTDLFNIKLTGILALDSLVLQNFKSLGTIEVQKPDFRSIDARNIKQGLTIKNPNTVLINDFFVRPVLSSGFTLFSFIIKSSNVIISLNQIVPGTGFNEGSSLFFLDPNMPSGGSFNITESRNLPPGDFYQLGSEIVISSVADNGSGKVRFTAASVHGLVVGKALVLDAFSESTYNGTFIVTAVPTTTTFDVEEITFNVDDTGTMNTSSLDSTDVQVQANSNPGLADSMFLVEARTTGTIEVVSILNTLVPIVDITPIAGDFEADPGTERFTVDTTTGIVTYIGLQPILALISYELNAEKTTGSDQNLNISLHINGTPQTKSDIPITATAAPGAFSTSSRKIFSVQPGDTLQLFLDNTTNSTNTNISKLVLVISKQ